MALRMASGFRVDIAIRGSRGWQPIAQPQAAARGRCPLDEVQLATSGQSGEEPRADGVEDTSDGEAQLVDQAFGEERLREGDAGVDAHVAVGARLHVSHTSASRPETVC